MTKIFSSPKAPAPLAPPPDPLPPPPARSDEETTTLAEEQRRRYAPGRGGRASTFLTQGGVTAGSSAVKFLGGAAAT